MTSPFLFLKRILYIRNKLMMTILQLPSSDSEISFSGDFCKRGKTNSKKSII